MTPASLFSMVAGSVVFAIVSSAVGHPPDSAAALRDQRRAELLESHYGVAETLQLEAAQFDKLIELVVEQQMVKRDSDESPAVRAERMNGYFENVRALLGPEKYQRYQALRYTHFDRRQVYQLDQRLQFADKLSASQREQLIALLFEYTMKQVEQQHRGFLEGSPVVARTHEPLSREELDRRRLLTALAANEQMFRRTAKADREVLDEAAGLLTPTQFETFRQLRTQQGRIQQTDIEQMRSELGLNPTIPERPDVAAGLARVDGEAKLRLRVTVNRDQPRYFTSKVSNDQRSVFQIHEGLFLEAEATLLEQDQYDLRLSYVEVGATGKHWIAGTQSSGVVVKTLPGDPERDLVEGGASTVILGDKAYAVLLSSVIEAI